MPHSLPQYRCEILNLPSAWSLFYSGHQAAEAAKWPCRASKQGVYLGWGWGWGGAQHGAERRKLLNKGISVILSISDESSVWLTHIAPCQSLPSVCSMKIFLNAFLPSLGSDFSLPPCIPWQFARWTKMRLAITAHPHGSEGKCLVDLRCEWLHLSLLMDASLGTCLSGGGHRWWHVSLEFCCVFYTEEFLAVF